MTNRYNENTSSEASHFGQILQSGSNGIYISGQADLKDVQFVAPYGIRSKPIVSGQAFIIPSSEQKYAVPGVSYTVDDLQSGEIEIKSSGGAYIKLKSNGQVIINGLTITPSGKIV